MLLPDFSRLRVLLRIGWPASVYNLTDLGVSTFMSILGARLGTQLLAAHQVVLDLDAVVYMLPMGILAGFPHTWASLYTNDPAVVAAAAPIFLICGFIQLGDATGVIYASALSGLGDTRTPMLIGTAWYWLLGMPLS